ncbi:MAG: glycosyltransferase, partial [Holophagales bacterium]|nr:glycosyltransferase [Holophagales bacterium]
MSSSPTPSSHPPQGETDPLDLVLLAPEHPPLLGGMAELAGGAGRALAESGSVRVFCLPSASGSGPPAAEPYPVERNLTGHPPTDARRLRSIPEPRAWLAMNAGLVPLAPHLSGPVFCYLHGNDFVNPWMRCGPRWLEALRRPYAARLRHALRRRAIRSRRASIRHFLTNSHQTAALARQRLGLAEDRLSVVYPGVGDAFFQDPEPRAAEAPLRLLTVTRLSPHTRRKNVDGVLRALADVQRSAPEHAAEWSYTVVGGGPDLPRLQGLARELGVADRVRFTGAVAAEDLLAEYRRADLFVLASEATATDVEGFGIVYIE